MHRLTILQMRLPIVPPPNPWGLSGRSPASLRHLRLSRGSTPNAIFPLEFTISPSIKTQKRKKAETDRAKGHGYALICPSREAPRGASRATATQARLQPPARPQQLLSDPAASPHLCASERLRRECYNLPGFTAEWAVICASRTE